MSDFTTLKIDATLTHDGILTGSVSLIPGDETAPDDATILSATLASLVQDIAAAREIDEVVYLKEVVRQTLIALDSMTGESIDVGGGE